MKKNRFNRHLYKSDQKLDKLKMKQDDYDDDEEYFSDTERDSWIMLSHDSDNNYEYNPIQTYDEEPQKEYTNIKQYYKIHKPKKINSCFKYVIKCIFSYYQIQYHKSDIEPWKSFAMKEQWKLHPMGFWERIKKNNNDNNDNENENESDNENEYEFFDENEKHKYV
eukprot:379295_1